LLINVINIIFIIFIHKNKSIYENQYFVRLSGKERDCFIFKWEYDINYSKIDTEYYKINQCDCDFYIGMLEIRPSLYPKSDFLHIVSSKRFYKKIDSK
jgi:hypothetical protein